jgi:hypothetical protein
MIIPRHLQKFYHYIAAVGSAQRFSLSATKETREKLLNSKLWTSHNCTDIDPHNMLNVKD